MPKEKKNKRTIFTLIITHFYCLLAQRQLLLTAGVGQERKDSLLHPGHRMLQGFEELSLLWVL